MTVGGLWAIFSLRKEMIGGVRAALRGMRSSRHGGDDVEELRGGKDLPMKILLPILAVASAGFIVAAFMVQTK
eukprot:gene9005-9363_t